MLTISNNFPLLNLNTFHVNVYSRLFCEINSIYQFRQLQREKAYLENHRLVLGGGSNILFLGDYEGLVIKNNIRGIEMLREDREHVYVKAGAGENWHRLVMWCIEHNYAGLENLSLIPGNVGASPMQNIGAYGVEIKDVFEELEAIDMESGEIMIFKNSECEFGYRESVFKKKYKDRFLISSVMYRLSKRPVFNTSYGAIEEELKKSGVKELSIRAISEAVIRIRSSKLPSPAQLGNAGSFFKNPEVGAGQHDELKARYPALVSYPLANGRFKLAAGWLIEAAGWKGKRIGDAGVHALQALVLVNYGTAAGTDIFELSRQVQDAVYEKFGVQLEREVNIVP